MKYRQKNTEDTESMKIENFLSMNMEITKLEIVNEVKRIEPEIIEKERILMEANDGCTLLSTLKWFDYFFKDNNYVLKDEVLLKILEIAQSEIEEISSISMSLIAKILCSNSSMVNFLYEHDIISLSLRYFPSKESFGILINLSLIHSNSKLEIMKSGIYKQLKDMVDSFDYFILEAIQLIDALVYKIDEDNYNAYYDEYLCLFNAILSHIENKDDEMLFLVLRTIRDFIDAKQCFLMHFIESNQLPKILSLNTNDPLSIYQIIQIAKCICIYAPKGYQYLLDNNILDWLSNALLNQDQTVLEKSFILLSSLIFEEENNVANFCIDNSFHLIAISRIKEDKKLFLKKAIFQFLLDLCNYASSDYLIDLYHEGVFYILFENISLSDEDNRIKIYDAFKQYRNIDTDENIEFLLSQMKENDDFMDWINEGFQSGNYDIANYTSQLFQEFS